jgi:endonuclease G, mitochondrial
MVARTSGGKRFKDAVEKTRAERTRVRQLVAEKRWFEAEPDTGRLRRYMTRKASVTAPRGAEAIHDEVIDFQTAWFLQDGAQARRTVAFVEVTTPGKSSVGSGFMVSPHLFLTNQHVIADEIAARGAQITFDRELGEEGRHSPTTSFLLDPDRFALFSREEELDYALIAIGKRNSGTAALIDFGHCILSDRPDKHAIGMNVNIIQHPGGHPKMIALRNNILQFRTERTLLYETDTEQGSSGAPVFNDNWDVVALHHYGEPFLEPKDEHGKLIPANVNEGVRVSAIYRDLSAKLPVLSGERQQLLAQALAYDKEADTGGRRLGGPRRSNDSSESILVQNPGGSMSPLSDPSQPSTQELRLSFPIEVTIRAGVMSATLGTAAVSSTAAPESAKALKRAPEKLQVDTDYSNRAGYEAGFIPGVQLPLPTPKGKLAKQIAPLRASEPNAEAGELKYEHFSVKLNKGKRMAIFTATNIDGETYLEVDRKTGRVRESAEAESWFLDSRVSASFFLDQSFYSEWSTYFDRGHLTRRTDPTWGSDEEAERANADTFHFTNCSPQHFRFNQTTRFWQGAERYVLENGVLAADSKRRLCVFQGPIFDNAVDRWADDVQIPSSFFKVIVWKGQGGLKSVGLIVDQVALLDEERRSLGQPQAVPSVNVSQWRVGIKTIEQRTKLDFGDTIRNADTIGTTAQPTVGEALIQVTSFEDLLR